MLGIKEYWEVRDVYVCVSTTSQLGFYRPNRENERSFRDFR